MARHEEPLLADTIAPAVRHFFGALRTPRTGDNLFQCKPQAPCMCDRDRRESCKYRRALPWRVPKRDQLRPGCTCSAGKPVATLCLTWCYVQLVTPDVRSRIGLSRLCPVYSLPPAHNHGRGWAHSARPRAQRLVGRQIGTQQGYETAIVGNGLSRRLKDRVRSRLLARELLIMRCYFMQGGQIAGMELLTAASDADAVGQAAANGERRALRDSRCGIASGPFIAIRPIVPLRPNLNETCSINVNPALSRHLKGVFDDDPKARARRCVHHR